MLLFVAVFLAFRDVNLICLRRHAGELAYSINDARNFSRLGQEPGAAPWPVTSYTLFPTSQTMQQVYPTALRVHEDGSVFIYASVASVPHNYGYDSYKGNFSCGLSPGCSGIATFLLREDGFVGLSLAPEAMAGSLQTQKLPWLGGVISLNVDCSGGGEVRVRALGSGSSLEAWTSWSSVNSTRWVPEGQVTETQSGETGAQHLGQKQQSKQVIIEVEIRRSGLGSGPILYSVAGSFVLQYHK